jgi:hypothetical protein
MDGMSNVASSTFMYYCFFHDNTATTGKDIYVESGNFGNGAKPLSGCYTTRGKGDSRCMQGTENKDEWFGEPVTELERKVNSKEGYASDSYGCGIDSSYPCLSSEFATAHALPGVVVEIVDEGSHKNHTIHILSGSLVEGKECGEFETPCGSLEEGQKHLKGTSKLLLIILGDIEVRKDFRNEETIPLSLTSTLPPSQLLPTVSFTTPDEPDTLGFTNTGTFTLLYLILSIEVDSLGEGVSYFFSSSGPSLTLDSCDIRIPSDPTFGLISITGGSLTLISTEIAPSSPVTFSIEHSLIACPSTGYTLSTLNAHSETSTLLHAQLEGY